jgi:hypothetical protein
MDYWCDSDGGFAASIAHPGGNITGFAALDSALGGKWVTLLKEMRFAALRESANGRFCCKSLFALLIKNSFGRRRDFRVNMWGTSSPGDKLTGDFGNEPDATSISDRGLFGPLAGNLSRGFFRLLQQNRHKAAEANARAGSSTADCQMLWRGDCAHFAKA